jgi:hypothetical protein
MSFRPSAQGETCCHAKHGSLCQTQISHLAAQHLLRHYAQRSACMATQQPLDSGPTGSDVGRQMLPALLLALHRVAQITCCSAAACLAANSAAVKSLDKTRDQPIEATAVLPHHCGPAAVPVIAQLPSADARHLHTSLKHKMPLAFSRHSIHSTQRLKQCGISWQGRHPPPWHSSHGNHRTNLQCTSYAHIFGICVSQT